MKFNADKYFNSLKNKASVVISTEAENSKKAIL